MFLLFCNVIYWTKERTSCSHLCHYAVLCAAITIDFYKINPFKRNVLSKILFCEHIVLMNHIHLYLITCNFFIFITTKLSHLLICAYLFFSGLPPHLVVGMPALSPTMVKSLSIYLSNTLIHAVCLVSFTLLYFCMVF